MSPALFGSGSDAFHQPQVAPGRGEAHRSRGGYVALWAPISVWSNLKVLGHTNTWPEEVLKRFNSSLAEVLAQVF